MVRLWHQRSNCRAYREGVIAFMVGETCKCEILRERERVMISISGLNFLSIYGSVLEVGAE